MALTVATMSLVYVALHAMLYGTPRHFIGGQLLMAVPLGMALGLQGAMLVEIFPLRTRITSMSLAYSVTLALAGGSAPLVAAWLRQVRTTARHRLLHMGYGAIGPGCHVAEHETNKRRLDQ